MPGPTGHGCTLLRASGSDSSTPSTENPCVSWSRQYPWKSGTPSGVRGGLKVFAFSCAHAWNARVSAGQPPKLVGLAAGRSWPAAGIDDASDQIAQVIARAIVEPRRRFLI